MRARLSSRCAGLCPRTAPSARQVGSTGAAATVRKGHSPHPRGEGDTPGCHSLPGLSGSPQPWAWRWEQAVGQGAGSKWAVGLILTVNIDEAGDEAESLGCLPAEPLAEVQGEGGV